MSDQELQRELAKMLPEEITQRHEPTSHSAKVYHDRFFWKGGIQRIKDTEWLHVVWLVEQALSNEKGELNKYHYELEKVCIVSGKDGRSAFQEHKYLTASWQQRARALIAVKGEK